MANPEEEPINKFLLAAFQKTLKKLKVGTIYSLASALEIKVLKTMPGSKTKKRNKANIVSDIEEKVKFINSCDAMIHARIDGETFGLAVGEFSYLNKPVITFKGGLDQNHLMILKERGLYYTDYNSLIDILLNLKQSNFDVTSLVTQFSPSNVMERFANIFLK